MLTLEGAVKLITPELAARLALCIDGAFRDWLTLIHEKARARLSLSAKAIIINDFMLFRAREIFPSDDPDVKIVKPKRGRSQLLIKNQLICKLKKLNNSLRPVNILTATVIHFNSQLPPPDTQLRLFPDDITHAIVGYRENALKTNVEAYMVCPNENRNLWIHPLGFTPLSGVPFAGTKPETDEAGGQSLGVRPKPVMPKNNGGYSLELSNLERTT